MEPPLAHMERARFIAHKDAQVLLIDLGGLVGRELFDVLGVAAKVIRAQPLDSVLTVIDAATLEITLRDGQGGYDRTLTDRLRGFTSGSREFVRAGAVVVGTDESKRVIAEFINNISERALIIFETRNEALDWLVDQ